MFHVHTYMHGWGRVSENKKVRETASLFIIIIIRGGGGPMLIHSLWGFRQIRGDFCGGREALSRVWKNRRGPLPYVQSKQTPPWLEMGRRAQEVNGVGWPDNS